MPNILVVYYTQTGQQKRILNSLTKDISKVADIDYHVIEPIPEFPYPWGSDAFFDCFPETVKGIPAKLKPCTLTENDYDLVIFGYQPWYLSPSIPANSFLLSEEAVQLMKNKPVITVIGARNMWTQAQEIVKERLHNIGARVAGNIVLTDKTDNYIAGITVIRWLVHGKKGPGTFLPEAGVSEKDIMGAEVYGKTISDAIENENFEGLQEKLIAQKAVPVKYHLVNIERNARKIFDIFANYVLSNRTSGKKNRRARRVKLFKFYLLFVFFVLSPIFSFIFMAKRVLFFWAANKEISYLKGVDLRKE